MATKVKKRKIRFSKVLAEEVFVSFMKIVFSREDAKTQRFFPAGKDKVGHQIRKGTRCKQAPASD
jgi:hypothetical protein